MQQHRRTSTLQQLPGVPVRVAGLCLELPGPVLEPVPVKAVPLLLQRELELQTSPRLLHRPHKWQHVLVEMPGHGQAVERRCRRRGGFVPSPSLFGMCTFVNDDRLGSLMTRDRKLSREHGPAASATSHRRRRRIVRSHRAESTADRPGSVADQNLPSGSRAQTSSCLSYQIYRPFFHCLCHKNRSKVSDGRVVKHRPWVLRTRVQFPVRDQWTFAALHDFIIIFALLVK
jgi:hypothetical protein